MNRFHINVFWSEEDACWVADVPDLAHCSAFGATPEEAMREVQAAQAAWIMAALESGREPPQPQYRPVIYQVEGRA